MCEFAGRIATIPTVHGHGQWGCSCILGKEMGTEKFGAERCGVPD
jgi:hypothetical protein